VSVRVAFLGPPGAGKGTQARELAQEWDVPHVATGEMLREAAAAGTPLGREAKGYMDRGALVPDDVIIRMIADRLRRSDARKGFLLDGFPRTIAQAEGLERLLKDLGQPLERVVYCDVCEPELFRRLTGRRLEELLSAASAPSGGQGQAPAAPDPGEAGSGGEGAG